MLIMRLGGWCGTGVEIGVNMVLAIILCTVLAKDREEIVVRARIEGALRTNVEERVVHGCHITILTRTQSVMNIIASPHSRSPCALMLIMHSGEPLRTNSDPSRTTASAPTCPRKGPARA